MQKKWLAKGTSAIAIVALIATATAIPTQAHAGGVGLFATEYTQLLNYAELVGQLEKQVMMVENQMTQIADMAKHGMTISNQLFGTVESDIANLNRIVNTGPSLGLYTFEHGRHIQAPIPWIRDHDELRAAVFAVGTNEPG